MDSITKNKHSLPSVTGSHTMSWKELAEADDLASAITVDVFLQFTTHKMTESRGSRINTLIGCIAELDHSEEVSFLKHRKNDFSVMYSSRKNCSQLWLGPAAYVNHDCQPNCEFTINCDVDARMSLESKVDIRRGQEIFIYYGKHFFDLNNCACECFTCELLGRGYFSQFVSTQPLQFAAIQSPTGASSNSGSATAVNDGTDSIERRASLGCLDLGQQQEQTEITRRGYSTRSMRSTSTLLTISNGSVNPQSATNATASLRKGSSTGLACRSLSNAYSLRHTCSRMDRVKARIHATANGIANPTIGQDHANHRNPATPLIIHPRPSRPEPPSPSAACDPLKLSGLNLPIVDELPNLPVSNEALNTGLVNSCTVSNSSHSPVPPQLDRMSSGDSVSMPSQLSTAANTPDPQLVYYAPSQLVPVEACEKLDTMPTLLPRQVESDEELGADWPNTTAQNSSDHTSSTSPATSSFEPILHRLIDESKPSLLPSDQPIVSLKPKRLTNYDARMIAEASLLPVGTTRSRRRRRVSLADMNSSADGIRLRGSNDGMSFGSDETLSTISERSTHRLGPPSLCVDGERSDLGICGTGAWEPMLVNPDFDSGPPSIVSRAHLNVPREIEVDTSCLSDTSSCSSSCCSSTTTPLRMDRSESLPSLDDIEASSDACTIATTTTQTDYSPQCDIISTRHLLNDHDYTKNIQTKSPNVMFINQTRTRKTPLSYRWPFSTANTRQNDTDTSPPTLHPVTPPRRLNDHIQSVPMLKVNRHSWEHSYNSLTHQTPSVFQTMTSTSTTSARLLTARSLTPVWSPVKLIETHKIPLPCRLPRLSPYQRPNKPDVHQPPQLTVTLKRIGPQHYQVAQPTPTNNQFLLL